MGKKIRTKENEKLAAEIKEIGELKSMELIAECIVRMFTKAKLPGYKIIMVLQTLMAHVIYMTCDKAKKNKEQWRKASDEVAKSIYEDLMFYQKNYEEDEQGKNA